MAGKYSSTELKEQNKNKKKLKKIIQKLIDKQEEETDPLKKKCMDMRIMTNSFYMSHNLKSIDISSTAVISRNAVLHLVKTKDTITAEDILNLYSIDI